MSKQTELAQLGDAVTVDSSGNVGIGTSSPSNFSGYTTLDVVNASNGGAILARGSTVEARFVADDPTGTVQVKAQSSHPLMFATAGTERMRIDSSGNVGINMTPDSAVKLSISGAVGTTNGSAGSPTHTFYSDADTGMYRAGANTLGFSTGGSERMRITTDKVQFNVDAKVDADNAHDLGAGGARWKDLYLSGSAQLANITNGAGEKIILNSDNMVFQVQASERMRIDSSGNVGIGTSSPNGALHVRDATNIDMAANVAGQVIIEGNGYTGGIALNATGMQIYHNSSSRSLIFGINETERMRLDSSGNLMVGTTVNQFSLTSGGDAGMVYRANASLDVARDDGTVMFINRLTSDGDLVEYRKNGSTVGSIGTLSSRLHLVNGDTGLRFAGDLDAIWPCNGSGGDRDNAIDLGSSGIRFDDIYATNGTIQTSDRNEKQDIEELTEAEQRVAVAAKGLLRKFRWKSAVEEKGDNARTHFGIIAQDLQAAFEAEGLDAGDYAMFISSTWTDEETGEERTRLGVRYSELLAFIIGAL